MGYSKAYRSIRHPTALLGAIIVISAVLIDPFTQQVISHYDCLQLDPMAIATLPRTNNYTVAPPDLANLPETSDPLHLSPILTDIDMGSQAAMYASLLDSDYDPSRSLHPLCVAQGTVHSLIPTGQLQCVAALKIYYRKSKSPVPFKMGRHIHKMFHQQQKTLLPFAK